MANRIEGVTEKLLEQAMKEFLDKGYTGASLRTIAENAGTTPRSVYTRYGDKEGLFAALVSECADTLKNMFISYMKDYGESLLMNRKISFTMINSMRNTRTTSIPLSIIYTKTSMFSSCLSAAARTHALLTT